MDQPCFKKEDSSSKSRKNMDNQNKR